MTHREYDELATSLAALHRQSKPGKSLESTMAATERQIREMFSTGRGPPDADEPVSCEWTPEQLRRLDEAVR